MTTPLGTQTYTYDALNRLTGITNPKGKTTTFSYDAIGRRTGMTYANAVNASYTYDDASRLLSLVNQVGATTISTFSYAYDKVSNRTQMVDNDGTHNYLYDQLYRLIDATHPQSRLGGTENFGYDPVGNRTTSQSRGTTRDYSYDNMNRLLGEDQYSYSYDANGNMTGGTISGHRL